MLGLVEEACVRGWAAVAAVVVAALGLVAGCSEATPSSSGSASAPSTSGSASTPGGSGSAGAPSGSGSASAPRGSGSPSVPGGTASANTGPVELAVASTVATGLDVPWGLAFLPDKSALVAERDSAKIKRIAGGNVTEVGKVDGGDASSEGGLLGLAVDPRYPARPYIYAYYSSGDDNRIARITYQDGKLSQQQVILNGIPSAAIHNGGRLRFGPDGYLYAGTGDGSDRPNSQDDNSLGGKILRITTDGKAAPGNPDGRVWITKGHRNVQGLAFDGNQLYAAEFGQNTWDELNVITPGSNYGWPAAEGIAGRSGFVDPVRQWSTADASPSGICIGPDGAVLMAALRGEGLWKVPVNGDGSTGEPEKLLDGDYGRLRDVFLGP